MAKHIFVTGGVVSVARQGHHGGVTRPSAEGARATTVTMQKMDPYFNVDPGTMSPFQHGEVFVTEDGHEGDLDLGHYERFIDENLSARIQLHRRAPSTRRSSRASAAATSWAAPCR